MVQDNDLLRLIKARRNKRLAEEAMSIANQPQEQVEPADDNLVAQANSLNTPDGPLGNPGFWSKLGSNSMNVLEKLAYPGEVGAGLLFQAFDGDARRRRSQIQQQTPQEGLGDFLKSSRAAYKEKDLPLAASLPLEILADPLTYVPFGLAYTGVKSAIKGGKAAPAIGKVYKSKELAKQNFKFIDAEDMNKSIKNNIENAAEKSRGNKFIQEKGGALKYAMVTAKGQAEYLDPKNEVHRIILDNLNFESMIRNTAAANTAKVGGPKGLKQVFDIDSNGLVNLGGTQRHYSRAIAETFDLKGVRKGVTDYDQLAKEIVRNNAALRKSIPKSVDEVGWLDVIVRDEGIAAIKRYKPKGTPFLRYADLTDDQIQAAGKYLYAFEVMGDQLRRVSPSLKLFQGATGGFIASKVLKTAEKADKIIREGGGKLSDPSSIKKRIFDGELEDAMVDSITSGKLQYVNDPEQLFQLYQETMLRYIGNSQMDIAMQKLAVTSKGKAAIFKASTANEIGSLNALDDILDPKLTKKKNIKKGSRFTKAEVAQMDRLGFKYLAQIANENPEDIAKILDARFTLNQQRGLHGSKAFAKDGQKGLPKNFNQYFFTGKNAEQNAKIARSLTGLADDTTFQKLSESVGGVGDVLRVGKTGFDLGFMLLQGLPMLGRAVTNPSLYKAWGDATINGFKALFSEQSLQTFVREMGEKTVVGADGQVRSLLDDYVLNGGNLSKYATDLYAGVPKVQQVLGKGGRVGAGVGKVLDSFERSFIHSGDVLKIRGYEILRPSILKNAPPGTEAEALKGLTSFLSKATGAMDPIAAGIPRSQSAVERAFFFFSPRYTRASFSLMADVFRGGVQGAEARKAMLGLAGFGMGTYVTYSLALGQEPELDPRSSRFMTVEINGNRVGLGSFWMSFARAAVKTGDAMLTDEDIMEEQRNNPIFNYLRGRTSPITSLGYDLWNGKDYLGRPFESNIDYLKHIGKAPIPFAIEGALLDDAYNSTSEKLTGVPFEFTGLRNRPMNIWERRYSLRDDLAFEKHGKEWNDLNRLQQKTIENESEQLSKANEDVRKITAEGGSDLAIKIETYYQEQDKIQTEFEEAIQEGIILMGEDRYFRPRELREIVLKRANNVKRVSYKNLNNRMKEGGDLADVDTYFTQMANKFSDEAQPEDVAYREFLTEIIGSEQWDRVEGYDWLARDEAIEDFKQRWGSDIFGYVEKRLKVGQNLPPILTDYYNAREKYEFYWEASEKAALETSAFPEYAQQLRTEYIRATDSERLDLIKNPTLVEINSKISSIKKNLRLINPGLDAFLYRWGYTDTLVNDKNKNEEYFWNQTNALELGTYDNGPVDFTNP